MASCKLVVVNEVSKDNQKKKKILTTKIVSSP